MSDYIRIIEKWQQNRSLPRHPNVFHKPEMLERAREKLELGDVEMTELYSRLVSKYGYILDSDDEMIINMIPETTPGPSLFNLSPEHEVGVPHGMWKWDPKNPDVVIDEITGTKFPNEKYPEEGELKTTWGKPQTFTFYTGKSILYNGFHVYPSFTGMVRNKKAAYILEAAYNLALLYHLTGNVLYAKKTAEILIRYADVYPYWLVHGMYGDIADMDPKIAGADPKKLPVPRTCMSPNMPINEIHVGYWGLSRGAGCGMDGSQITLPAALAYDLIAEAKDENGNYILTEQQKIHIEKDLLIESVTLVINDPALNNKSTGNRIGIMAAGLVTGIDEYVNVGKECFLQIVENWYLKDGSTSESPAYSMMVMNTMWILSEMLEGFKGFTGDEEALPVYDWYKYHAVWKGMYDTLLQNLLYPASADSYPDSHLNRTFCSILAYRFNKPEYWALLNEAKKKEKKDQGRDFNFLPPKIDHPENPKLKFRDVFFPDLKQAYMRIGKDNQYGTLILNASEWGAHHHWDSLNLFYFYNGMEWLSDLGYLWDQPHKKMTMRTPAHQLTVVDEEEQLSKGRNGLLHHYLVKKGIKLSDMSSDVYPKTKQYRRACLLVEHSEDEHYILDMFLVDGGSVKDYLIHGINFEYETEGFEHNNSEKSLLYEFKDPIVINPVGDKHVITWKSEDKGCFDVFLPSGNKEKYMLCTGFGQRGKTDMGAEIPYLMRRYEKDGAYTFISVMGAYKDDRFVKSFEILYDNAYECVVNVTLNNGKNDLIIYNFNETKVELDTYLGKILWDGSLAVIRIDENRPEKVYMYGGTALSINQKKWIAEKGRLQGAVVDWNETGFVIDMSPEVAKSIIGDTIYVTDDKTTVGYTVQDFYEHEKGIFIKTLDKSGEGFAFLGGSRWRMDFYYEF